MSNVPRERVVRVRRGQINRNIDRKHSRQQSNIYFIVTFTFEYDTLGLFPTERKG